MTTVTDLQRNSEIFWGEISPCEHLVQIYEADGVFLDSLVGFVGGGLRAGDAVVVIATAAHRNTLERRLTADGFDIATALSRDQYIPLDADETLSRFVVSGWPDEDRFNRLVNDLLVRARGHGRRVRAFGEMVAVLWAQGHNGATVRLEHLWHRLCQAEAFSLFCAYPRIGLTQDTSASFKEICATHTKVIGE